MTGYVIRRLVLLLPVLWGVGTFTFVILRLLPGDAVDTLLEDSQNFSDIDALRAELGIDQPMGVQYFDFLRRAATLDFGDSLISRRPVAEELMRAIPVSAELAVIAVLVTVAVAVPGGILAASRQDLVPDYLARMFAVTFLAVPNFWLATMALVLPAMWFGWLPPLKYHPITESPLTNLQQFITPGIIIGVSGAAIGLRMMRSQLLEVLRQDYIRTARSKGLDERHVLTGHALRNAMIPTLTLFAAEFGNLLNGTVITETIFGLPGVGLLTIDAITKRDYPQVQANVLFFGVIYVFVNLAVDLVYVALDPRISYE